MALSGRWQQHCCPKSIGLADDNQSATAREQSWHDATAAVDAIRSRFGTRAVGAASMVTEDGVQVPARRDAPWGPDT